MRGRYLTYGSDPNEGMTAFGDGVSSVWRAEKTWTCRVLRLRRTSIRLDQCIGEETGGNLVFGDDEFIISQCHSIGFNETLRPPCSPGRATLMASRWSLYR